MGKGDGSSWHVALALGEVAIRKEDRFRPRRGQGVGYEGISTSLRAISQRPAITMTITHAGCCPNPCLHDLGDSSVGSVVISPWLLPTTLPTRPASSITAQVLAHHPQLLWQAPPHTEYCRNTMPPEPSVRRPASCSVLAHGFPWVPDAPQQDASFPRHAQRFPISTPWSGDEVHPLKVSLSFHGGESTSSVEGAWWRPGHFTPCLCR